MSMSMFVDPKYEPNDILLESILGEQMVFFLALREFLEKNCPPIKEEWKYYGEKIGWNLKIFHKKRNLMFFVPYHGFIRFAFVFGDKAVVAIEQSDLPADIIDYKLYIYGPFSKYI